MVDLLNKLHNNLLLVFNEKLSLKEKKLSANGEIDVLSTFVSLTKTQKDFRMLIEESAHPKDSLIYEFTKETFTEAKVEKFIQAGQSINDNKFFITSTGLYYYYLQNNKDLNPVFNAFDDYKFPVKELKLKKQEKIWCIFLILFGADSKDHFLDTSKTDLDDLDNYFSFLKTIEQEIENVNIEIGKEITWGKGKNLNFRKFITNTIDLPKTGIYHYPGSKYWLDLSKRRNVKFLLDLILDEYSGAERIIANELLYTAVWNLSNKMLSDLGEMPRPINDFIKEELRG